MTPAPAPLLTDTISPSHALHLLASTPAPPLIDARPLASHLLERIVHSLHSPPLPSLTHHPLLLFYDSGSSSLHHLSSPAPAAVAFYASRLPTTHLLLVQGGLPALRHRAPHLVETDRSAPDALRARLAHHPWALRLLAQVAQEAQPPARLFPWLFVGAAAHAYKRGLVRSYAFTHIVVAAEELDPRFPDLVRYLALPAEDTPGYQLKRHFPDAVEFLERLRRRHEAGERVACLVHCYAGASRSVALVAAYLIWADRVSVQVALDFIKKARPAAQPNHGFVKQLGMWEKELHAGMHRQLGQPPAQPLIASFLPVISTQNLPYMRTLDDDDDDEHDDEDAADDAFVEEPLEALQPSESRCETPLYTAVSPVAIPLQKAAAAPHLAPFEASSPVSPYAPPQAELYLHTADPSSNSSAVKDSVKKEVTLTLAAPDVQDAWTAGLSDTE